MDDAREITFEDLLDGDEAAAAQLPLSLEQLRADGFPLHGGVPALAAIERMAAADARSRAIRRSYGQILALQRHAA